MAEISQINLIINCIESYKKQAKVVSDITSLLSTRNAKLGILDIIKIVVLLEEDQEILRVLRNVAVIMGKPPPQYHSSQTGKNDKRKWFGFIQCIATGIAYYKSADKCISLNYVYNNLALADIRSENEFFDCFMVMILVQGYSGKDWPQLSYGKKTSRTKP
ncbi:unnamed protein product [Cylicocyclus nassatus]|uniref:Uncharacterized protein n=1 Tax=Cylicocyclus nassatus TaxID=53992 RepID=A0AA36GCB3_CYLNA|nr:unnamed protein product [Cylicocyclus nassatus]